jgi:hypothetical protein
VISYEVYKIIHYVGFFALFVTLGAALARSPLLGGTRDPWRRALTASHGVGLFLILLGGFGMLARLGVEHGNLFPGWIWIKLVLWVVAGALISVAWRRAGWAGATLVLLPLIGILAGAVALLKPF